MATYTTYSDTTPITRSGGGNAASYPAVTVLENIFDASLRNLAAADVATVLDIPAKTLVMNVFYEVLTADATQTINLGDGTDPDGFFAAADVGTLGNKAMMSLALTEATPNTVTRYTGGKFYSAADTIDIEVPSGKALDTLKIRVCAVVAALG